MNSFSWAHCLFKENEGNLWRQKQTNKQKERKRSINSISQSLDWKSQVQTMRVSLRSMWGGEEVGGKLTQASLSCVQGSLLSRCPLNLDIFQPQYIVYVWSYGFNSPSFPCHKQKNSMRNKQMSWISWYWLMLEARVTLFKDLCTQICTHALFQNLMHQDFRCTYSLLSLHFFSCLVFLLSFQMVSW